MSFSRVIHGTPEVKLLKPIRVYKSDCSNLFYTGCSRRWWNCYQWTMSNKSDCQTARRPILS